MSAGDELFEDIKNIRKTLEALLKEVAGLSKRAQEQGKHLSRAELDEVLAKVKQETSFSIRYDLLADRIQPHLATPDKVDAVLVSGLQRVELEHCPSGFHWYYCCCCSGFLEYSLGCPRLITKI
jgi:hypothetical protein